MATHSTFASWTQEVWKSRKQSRKQRWVVFLPWADTSAVYVVWCRVDSIVIVPQLLKFYARCWQHEAWGVISVDRCAEISSIASAQLPIMAEFGERVPESDAWSVQLTLHDEKWWRLRCLFLCSFPTAALFLPALMACFWFMVPWVTCSLWWPATKMFYTKIAQSSLFMAYWKESKGGFPMSQTWLHFFFADKTTGISLAPQSVVRKKTWCNYAQCHFSPALIFSTPSKDAANYTLLLHTISHKLV